MDLWLIILIIVLVVAVVAGIAIGICICKCCRKKSQDCRHDIEGGRRDAVDAINSLDLHGYTKREAMFALKNFLARYENDPRSNQLLVITGRGKHSANGEPVIKPAVQDHLMKNRLRHKWTNEGAVMIYFPSR